MKTISILVYLGFTAFCTAQNHPLQSPAQLKSQLLKAKTDTARVNTMLKLAQYYYDVSEQGQFAQKLDSAIFYGDSAGEICDRIKYQKGIGKTLLLFANICLRNDIKSTADNYARDALAIFEKTGTKNDQALCYLVLGTGEAQELPNNYLAKAQKLFGEVGNKKGLGDTAVEKGFLLMNEGKTAASLASFKQALLFYKAASYKNTQKTYSLMGLALDRAGEPNMALAYGLKAIRLVEQFKDTSSDAAQVYTYTAGTYLTLYDTIKMIEYQKKAYTIVQKHPTKVSLKITIESHLVKSLINCKRNNEALVYLKKLEEQYPALPKEIQLNIATLAIKNYSKLKQFKNAEKYVSVATKYLKDANSKQIEHIDSYSALIEYYLGIKDYNTARKLAEVYKLLSEQNNFKIRLKEVHLALFRIDSAQHNFTAAITHYQQATAWNNKVLDDNKNKQIAELEIQYETDKKDRSNKLLSQKNKLQQAELKQSNLIKNSSIIGILFLIAFLGVVYRLYSIKQRSNTQLELQKREIDGKNEVLQKLINEKEWLLKEIHHRVKNNLQIIMSLLNIQYHFLEDTAAMSAIRSSQHRIHSMSLIHKKLYQSDDMVAIDMPNYIKDLIEYFKDFFETKSNVRFITGIDPISLDISQAVPIGLILNEAITNSIKHAFPDGRKGTITVDMKQFENSMIVLTISDNGIGFPIIENESKASLGMKLISGFADDLDAKLEIKQTDGFSITVTFFLVNIPGQDNGLSNLAS